MMARDVMTAEVVSVTPGMTLREVAKVLVEKGISGVPVVDCDGLPVGMVTEGDLIAADNHGEGEARRDWWLTHLAEGEPLSQEFLAHLDRAERLVRDVMASPVVTVTEAAELPEIARLLTSYRIKRVPVVREGRIVGIVSRADLVRLMASEPAKPQPTAHRAGMLSEAVANLEDHFTRSRKSPPPAIKAEPSPQTVVVKADEFRALVDEFGHKKAHQHEEEKRAAAERRKVLVKDLIAHHVEDGNWREILRRAQAAAELGQKELLLLRFPCELCSDGGRAINTSQPNWPETLRGEAAEIYLRWERDLKPNGFHLVAQVVDFPGGIPGDIGMTLVWGG